MFKTHGVALHPGIGHSRGMFFCLRMATASFNGTTHRHVLLIFLRTILVHMQLDFPVPNGPLEPSNSTIFSTKCPQKAPKISRICAHWPPTAPNQKQTISWATWLKMRFRVHLIHPQPPTFGGFHPSTLP